ncbi:hypothetical protein [Stieleria mannarensis]|uniref:hypothetical protein n=1 Tax=Stieleria mannarensis TaxID=2755585 RepID=UPI0015FED4D6|nr:hypothetical protein [Rhodopirellula sp. JC639]
MRRVNVIASVVFLGVLAWPSIPTLAQNESTDVWVDRLVGSLHSVSDEDDSVTEEELESVMLQAGYALSLAGRPEQAIRFLRSQLKGSSLSFAMLAVADAQATMGHVEEAQKIVKSLTNEPLVKRARSLIAIRQAQRGDYEISVQLIDQIEDFTERDRARKNVINELLEAHRYKDVVDQYARVTDKEIREDIRQRMERVRQTRRPSDPDYVEKTIAAARQLKSRFGGFSEQEAALLKFECHARIAAHREDRAAFTQAIDDAIDLVQDLDVPDRCSALLSLGMICAQSGDAEMASDLFADALKTLFDGEQADFDRRFKVYLGLAAGDRFETIAQVMSEAELLKLSEYLRTVPPSLGLLNAFGRGLGAANKTDVADTVFNSLRRPVSRIRLSSGTLYGMTTRETLPKPSVATETPHDESREGSPAMIDDLIAVKPPLEFRLSGKRRPERESLGAYNVSRAGLQNHRVEVWQEIEQLPKLTLEEFSQVRSELVSALWEHGSVNGFPATEGEHDFFVYDDKFFDRTQKIEIHPSDDLPSILPAAVAKVQKVLAKHRLWRVMVIGHGENAKDEFFVIYPDAIKILQATNGRSMAEAIRANAKLRALDK